MALPMILLRTTHRGRSSRRESPVSDNRPSPALAASRTRTGCGINVPSNPGSIGARKVSQPQDNLASLDLELSAAQLKSLEEQAKSSSDSPKSIYERKWFVSQVCGMWTAS